MRRQNSTLIMGGDRDMISAGSKLLEMTLGFFLGAASAAFYNVFHNAPVVQVKNQKHAFSIFVWARKPQGELQGELVN